MALDTAFNRAQRDKKTVDVLASLAFEPVGGTLEHFAQALSDNVESYHDIIKRTGITMNQ